jgi:two-component system phosphate regulon response regulator PhoB
VTPRVLVVEDEDALATLLQYNLEKEGYHVAYAGDGEEALIQIDERLPDLVLLASRSAGACASAPRPATSRSSC